MAQIGDNLKKFLDSQLAQTIKHDKIAQAALAAGIINNPAQRYIYDIGKMYDLLALYVDDLKRQAEPTELGNGKVKKGSTASPNKYLEVACRVLYALDNELPIALHDFSCRSAGESDWVCSRKNADRCHIEIKSGRGELSKGISSADTISALEAFCRSDSMFLWYYDLRSFDYTAKDALYKVDSLPYIFMSKAEFMERLTGYNGDPSTWLAIKETAVNLQAVTTSDKKMAYLSSMADSGYDWIVYRKTGKLIRR